VKALVAVVCQAYVEGVSTRRVDDLVKTMGIEGISKSEVSRMAEELDVKVAESESDRWTRALTATCGSTPSPSGCARTAGWSTSQR
jgi:transposase-like protein